MADQSQFPGDSCQEASTSVRLAGAKECCEASCSLVGGGDTEKWRLKSISRGTDQLRGLWSEERTPGTSGRGEEIILGGRCGVLGYCK